MPKTSAWGIELDVRYGDSPIVCATDGEAPPWDRRTFVPTVAAGAPRTERRGRRRRDLVRPVRPRLHPRRRRPGSSDAKRLLDESRTGRRSGASSECSTNSRLCQLYAHKLVLVRQTCTSPGAEPPSPTPPTSSRVRAARDDKHTLKALTPQETPMKNQHPIAVDGHADLHSE